MHSRSVLAVFFGFPAIVIGIIKIDNGQALTTSVSSSQVFRANKQPDVCPYGQYRNRKTRKCEECPFGQYLELSVHGNQAKARCERCTKAQPELGEMVITNCTKTQDSTIGCKSDFLKRKEITNDFPKQRCLPCPMCQMMKANRYKLRPCDNDLFYPACCPDLSNFCCPDSTTVCCPVPPKNTEKYSDEFTYTCNTFRKTEFATRTDGEDVNVQSDSSYNYQIQSDKNSQVKGNGPYCKTGQYFANGECFPCPDGTYQPKYVHRKNECWTCESEGPDPQAIMGCPDKFTQVIIACKGDHFMHKINSNTDTVECRPCRKDCNGYKNGSFIGRLCSNQTNTLCCPQPNMRAFPDESGSYSVRCEPVSTISGTTETTSGSPSTGISMTEFLDTLNTTSNARPDPSKVHDIKFSTPVIVSLFVVIIFIFCIAFRRKLVGCISCLKCENCSQSYAAVLRDDNREEENESSL